MNINQYRKEILRVKNEKVKGPAGSVGSIMTTCRTGTQSTVHKNRWSWFCLLQVRSDWAESKLGGTKHTDTEVKVETVL